jgi:hypothetical protein
MPLAELWMCGDWNETCSVACMKFLLYKDKISAKLNLSSFTYMLSTQKKYKGRPFTCEATTDGRQICICTLALHCRRLVSATIQPFYPQKRDLLSIESEGRVSLAIGLFGSEKSGRHGFSNPGPFSLYRVTKPAPISEC